MPILGDRVRETTSTTGTGNYTTTGAAANCQTLASKLTTNGDTSWYCAVNASQWEVGLLTRLGATSYARTTVLDGSNGTSAVNFTTAPDLFLDLPSAAIALAAVPQVARVTSEYSSGTSYTGGGGTVTTSAHNTVTLNTMGLNTIPGASLSSNQLTLPAGTYEIQAVGAFLNIARLELYDATNSAYLLRGVQNALTGPTSGGNVTLNGFVVLTGTVALELRVYVGATAGVTATLSNGDNEVYASMIVRRIGVL